MPSFYNLKNRIFASDGTKFAILLVDLIYFNNLSGAHP